MEIKDFFLLEDKEYWLKKIGESDWRAGKYLCEILSKNQFNDMYGKTSKVFLLIEGKELVSFCTYSEKDEVDDGSMTPWIGFVYTFPAFRGKRRIGKLIEHIYLLAKSEGHRFLFISTDQKGLYEKFGFKYLTTTKTVQNEDTLVYRMPIENLDYSKIIGQTVKGTIDRPLGSAHPRHPEMIYPINYGYVDNVFAPDGAEQDVYVFGTDHPIRTYQGKVMAVLHRINDVEDKWIVTLDDRTYSNEAILNSISFQEQYYIGELYR